MATNQEIVDKAQQLYVSYYGRPADPGGLAFWIEYFTETDDVDQALVEFGDSEEFLAILAENPTSTELINQLYQFMFNRDAEQEGLDFYTDLLDSGAASLASIALDIANGAQNEDLTALNNKIEVANTFTAEVASEDASYTSSDIPGAQALLATVDETQASVDAAEAAIPDLVEMMNGFFTLTEDNPVGDFSNHGTGVTVTLDGDDSETEFSVTGSAHDDVVLFEEYFKATIDGGAGVDTVDFTDAAGAYTVSLDTGTFTADEDGDGLPDFSGNLTSIESVIGSDGDDVINGGDGNDILAGGDGADTLRGGNGDDTFLYEDETDLGTEEVNGQSGADTLDLSASSIDLSLVDDQNLKSLEYLSLSNGDGDNNVTLTLDGVSVDTVGPEDFLTIIGSSAVDTINLVHDADLGNTKLVAIDVLSSLGDITITVATLTDVTTVVGPVANDGNLTLASKGSYDLSGTVFSKWDTFTGTTSAGDILILTQTQIDSLLDGATAGVIFASDMDDASGTTTITRDILQAASSLDLTDMGTLNVAQIDFGSSTLIELNESSLGGSDVYAITGTTGTLIINDDDDDQAVALTGTNNATGVAVQGIATLSIAADAGTKLTIDEAGLTGTGQVVVTGGTGVLELDDDAAVDISGVDLSDFTAVSFGAVAIAASQGTVLLGQSNLDNFDTWGTGLAVADTLEFVLSGSSLNLSNVDFDAAFVGGASTVLVTGTTGNDTITEADGDADGALMFTYDLGEGNDTFNSTEKTEATAAITVNGGAGNDTVNLTEANTGAQTATGGIGNDKLVAGDATDTLTGGRGDDTFTIAMNQTGVSITDFGLNNFTAGTTSNTTLTANTGTDIFKLNFGVATASSTTAFSDAIVSNRLAVLSINVNTGTPTTTTGNIANIAVNNKIGASTTGLTNYAAITATLNALDNIAAIDNADFVLFAQTGTLLKAFVIDNEGPATGITALEISTVTIASLGAGATIAEVDLILI